MGGGAGLDRRLDLPGVHERFAREVARAAIRDRDLAERWLDRSVSGFTNHVTSPWRWHSHLLRLWEEDDEELIGMSWEGARARRAARRSRRPGRPLRARPERLALGPDHRLDFPHAFAGANPLFDRLFNRSLEAGGGQETVS